MSWVDWVLPALIGAVIGFVTNDIAIRMLFRPLTQKKIFGIPVPFTPGVIPRQRHKLAASLGRMTSNELLSPESVMAHLRRPGTVAALGGGLASILHGFLERPFLYYLDRFFPSGAPASPWVLALAQSFLPLLHRLWDTPLEKVFPEGVRSALARLTSAVTDRLTGVGDKEPASLVWLETLLLDRFPSFHETLEEWLRTPEVRQALNEAGLYLLRRSLEQMGAVQRFLVSAVQYDKSLEASMPELTVSAVNRFLRFLDDPAHRQDLVQRAVSAAVQGWDSGAFSDKIGPYLADLWEGHRRDSLGSTLKQLFGWERETWETWLSGAMGGTGDIGQSFLEGLKERSWVQTPLQDLLGLGSEPMKELAGEVADSLLDVVESHLSSFLRDFDVQAMVENRVNSLELERVESLLLQVIERHLKWINVFGALLGALLGVTQSLLVFFGAFG